MNEPIRHIQIGAVVIGRNEGERLRRCLQSLEGRVRVVVYVDSGSTDQSVAVARDLGAVVIGVDGESPFTAARARNAGWKRLREEHPDLDFVQFVDGDCEVVDGWFEAAVEKLQLAPKAAIVCGRRRERRPDQSIYNRLCDIEWNTPVGVATACGGDSLMRLQALKDVGGFRDDLIAGEEPELCIRLRRHGWSIERIKAEMTLHDAAMTRFSQWWRRSIRAGHAFAEGHALHGSGEESFRRREVRSIVLWGLLVPFMILLLAIPTHGVSIVGFGIYAFIWLRVHNVMLTRGFTSADANLYAASCVAGKLPQAIGAVQFWWNRFRGRRRTIIEYKVAVHGDQLS